MGAFRSQTLALAVPWVVLTQETPCSDSFHISFTPFSFLTPEVQTLEYAIILNIKYKNWRDGLAVKRLRALAEDLGWIASTHTVMVHNC